MTLSPRQVRDLLDAHGLSPSRALGQNFVADPNTVRRIARLADVGPGEIGPVIDKFEADPGPASGARAGDVDLGVTDEGDPWFVFCDAESGDVVAHFARIGGTYLGCAPTLNGALQGRNFAVLIERFLQRRLGGRLASVKSHSTPAA